MSIQHNPTPDQCPLPHHEMINRVKENIHFESICTKIKNKILQGSIEHLEQIVQLTVSLQYQQGTIIIGRLEIDINDVAHRLLQLRQHEVEYVLDNLSRKKIPPADWDAHLIASLYNAVGSLYAYRFYQSKTYKR